MRCKELKTLTETIIKAILIIIQMSENKEDAIKKIKELLK